MYVNTNYTNYKGISPNTEYIWLHNIYGHERTNIISRDLYFYKQQVLIIHE